MSLVLLKIGIILLPFYELLARACPYVMTSSPDTRSAKMFVALWLALAIGLSALFTGEIQRCKNFWILLFLIFIPLNIHSSPQYNIELNGVLSPNYWVWKPFVTYLCFFSMFMAVQSLNITRESFKSLANVMVLCGVVMAVYVVLQDFGWDQFFDIRTGGRDNMFFRSVTKPVTVGTLGNSTIVSPYIAMIIPFALYLKKYIIAGLMILAVCATHSVMAIGAMVVSLMVYSCLKWKVRAVLGVVLVVLVALYSGLMMKYKNPAKFAQLTNRITLTNGRLPVWEGIIKGMKEKEFGAATKARYSYTGLGTGAYAIIMRPAINTNFIEAHNEYLQVFCEMGIIGLILFLGAIGFMLKSFIHSYIAGINNPELIILMTSFICIALVAFGTFVWQLAPFNYYTVLVVGLLHNHKILKGELG